MAVALRPPPPPTKSINACPCKTGILKPLRQGPCLKEATPPPPHHTPPLPFVPLLNTYISFNSLRFIYTVHDPLYKIFNTDFNNKSNVYINSNT